MAKDIIIKVKEHDDRKVLFKLPYSIDVILKLDDLNCGLFTISFELEELKDMIKQEKMKAINNKKDLLIIGEQEEYKEGE